MCAEEKFFIGQVVAASGLRDRSAIFEPGRARWHGLFVPPQREAATEAWLERRGVYSFHPVTSRTVTIRGKRIRRESRYLPGYVFARFPGLVLPHRVMASPFVVDFIRMSSGHIATLHPDDLTSIHAMRSRDEEAEAAMREARAVRTGDRAKVLSGIMAGQEVEVLEIRHGRAVFRVTMFGGEVDAEVSCDALEKVQALA